MRLIDADALRKEIQKHVFPITNNNLMGAADTYYRILYRLDDASTIDAVPVVRCKDCLYSTDSWAKVNEKGFLICPASGMEITDNDYCSYGERKDGDGDEQNP